MARMTVYIPDDLKNRMDKTREEINWSQLACAAFDRKLGDIASRKARGNMEEEIERLRAAKQGNMEEVIERLRASKQVSGSGRFKAGFAAGQDWAKDTAEASELENLERFHDESANRTKYEKTWIGIFDLSIDHDYDSLPETLFYRMRPADDDDSSEADEFWEKVAGHDWEDLPGSWYRGFCEGALDIWRQVKDQL